MCLRSNRKSVRRTLYFDVPLRRLSFVLFRQQQKMFARTYTDGHPMQQRGGRGQGNPEMHVTH